MARNAVVVRAEPERVFAVLSEPASYAEWVVGAADVRSVEGEWPAVGSRLHHSTGVGPLSIDDATEVVACEPPSRLELVAHVGPLGTFGVVLRLERVGDSLTHVSMEEEPIAGPSRLAGPAADAAGRVRNRLSLDRLKTLAER